MTLHSMIRPPRRLDMLLALTFAAGLSGCAAMPENRLLDSIHQPVVEHSRFQLDLATGPDGLAPEDRARLEGWFGALALRYGDRVAIDDPLAAPRTRAEVKSAAARYGLLIGQATPLTPGIVNPGTVRIIVTRAIARVAHCPDLATKSESNFNNATSSNYGCAVNGNLAAMVANPDDLVSGAHEQGLTSADEAARAIWMHQAAVPTGNAGVAKNSTN